VKLRFANTLLLSPSLSNRNTRHYISTAPSTQVTATTFPLF